MNTMWSENTPPDIPYIPFSEFKLFTGEEEVNGWEQQWEGVKEIPKLLEDYPRIMNAILLSWGYPKEFHDYVNGLFVVAPRKHLITWVIEHSREGFSPEAMQEIFLLTNIHDEVFGKPKEMIWKKTDIWS
jgi:hypothetical protein